MTELFTQDGHLTDEALEALLKNQLSESGRLEAGEHLSYCDACLARYTALLTGEVLEEPEDLTLPILQKAQKKKMKNSLRRISAAAAAVAVGSTLFYSGILQAASRSLAAPPDRDAGALVRQVSDWSDRLREKTAPAFRTPEKTFSQKPNQTEVMTDETK